MKRNQYQLFAEYISAANEWTSRYLLDIIFHHTNFRSLSRLVFVGDNEKNLQ